MRSSNMDGIFRTDQVDKAKRLNAKFKNLKRVFKDWKSQLPSLASTIQNAKETVQFLDTIEEFRDLTLEEWNFRVIVEDHIKALLHQQKTTGNIEVP